MPLGKANLAGGSVAKSGFMLVLNINHETLLANRRVLGAECDMGSGWLAGCCRTLAHQQWLLHWPVSAHMATTEMNVRRAKRDSRTWAIWCETKVGDVPIEDRRPGSAMFGQEPV